MIPKDNEKLHICNAIPKGTTTNLFKGPNIKTLHLNQIKILKYIKLTRNQEN
jgi:hypothetical protein